MDVKANKNGSKTVQVKTATHRKLKRQAGSRRLFEYADEMLKAGMKQESGK